MSLIFSTLYENSYNSKGINTDQQIMYRPLSQILPKQHISTYSSNQSMGAKKILHIMRKSPIEKMAPKKGNKAPPPKKALYMKKAPPPPHTRGRKRSYKWIVFQGTRPPPCVRP